MELKRIGRSPVSLDQNVGDDGDTRIADLISDDDAVAAAEIAEHNAMMTTLRTMVKALPERQAAVLTMRYGLRDGKPRTLAEIAVPLGPDPRAGPPAGEGSAGDPARPRLRPGGLGRVRPARRGWAD